MPLLPPKALPKVVEGDIREEIEIALNKQGLVRVFLNAQYSGPARGGYTRAGLGTGTSDLVGYVLGTGRFFALEVKTSMGRVSDAQAAWIAQTNREGGYAAIARTAEEACRHAWKASKGEGAPSAANVKGLSITQSALETRGIQQPPAESHARPARRGRRFPPLGHGQR